MDVKTYSREFAGRTLSVEIGKLAGQANGSCRVQYDGTVVLVTAVISSKPKDADFFPLTVDYEEKYYAAGKIKGSRWIKRETRPSDEAVLSGRLIDRSIRPRFNHNIRNEIQVVATVLSFDGKNDPDMVALFGASLALIISDIPFDGPVAGIRVGRKDGKILINPSYEDRANGDFDIVVAGDGNKINMLEAGAKIIPEHEMVAAVDKGFSSVKGLIEFQKEIAEDIAPKKKELNISMHDEALTAMVHDFVSPKLEKILYTPHKQAYVEGLSRTMDELVAYLNQEFKGHPELSKKLKDASKIFEEEIDRIVHKNILEEEKRPDGRKLDELRSLSVETSVLPYAHGSGLFNRGSTQALSVLTLGAPGMEQYIETMEIDLTKKRFMHHYVFPPFSVGEVGRMGGGGRREIGHGALAERALIPLVPDKESFPYTIRVVSEILSSNGSSSMASVCGAALALMDGGVPISAPAAGIAMGLMSGKDGTYKILTDIQGPEDHHGDMDMKVAGTANGITALQMDVKIDGINIEILKKTLEQAKKARIEILSVMAKEIASPRENLSPHAPRVISFLINPDKIGKVIGQGGKVINEIIDKTGVTIDIEDDGRVFITSDNEKASDEAMAWVKGLTREAKPGEVFDARVVKIVDFGVFVEIFPGQEGLVHVSEMRHERVKHPSDVVKVGDVVKVRVKNIDDYGKISLSMKF